MGVAGVAAWDLRVVGVSTFHRLSVGRFLRRDVEVLLVEGIRVRVLQVAVSRPLKLAAFAAEPAELQVMGLDRESCALGEFRRHGAEARTVDLLDRPAKAADQVVVAMILLIEVALILLFEVALVHLA